jgi:hypothetical protein
LKLAFRDLLRDIGRGTFKQFKGNNVKLRSRKYYPIYSLVRKGTDVIMRYKRVLVTDFYKHFNINRTNRIVGYTPDFVGASRSQIVKAKNYINEFISDEFYNIKSEVTKACFKQLIASINEPRVVYSAGYDTCTAHLKEYFKDNTTEEFLNRDKLLSIIKKSNFKWFVAPECTFTSGSELFDYVRINPDSYPGHYSAKIFGKNKSLGDELSRYTAYKLWRKIYDKPIKNLYLWKILGREKDIKFDMHNNNEKEVGTRVVMTCESPITYLLMWMAQKFTYVLARGDWDKTFNLYGEFNASKSYKLIDKSLDYDYVLEADWSYYDSNIDTHFLELGAALLCNAIPDSKINNNMVTTFIMSVVTKYVIIPPGIVAELNRSQPSGHPAGSLINCYVNLMYWCVIGYKIYGDNYADYMSVEVYGDDTRAYFKDHPNLVYIDNYIKECGLQSDKVLPNIRSTKFECDSDQDIDFLKRRFDQISFKWNHKKMFDKWLYQSKNRTLNDQVKVVLSFLESVPTDEDLIKISKLFIKWLDYKYSGEINRDTNKVIESINLLISGGIPRIDEFKYEYGSKVTLRSYFEQIQLHSFSLYRPKNVLLNEKYTYNSSVSKFVILYALSMDHIDLALLNELQFLRPNRSPPLFAQLASISINRSDRLMKCEVNRLINSVNKSIYR